MEDDKKEGIPKKPWKLLVEDVSGRGNNVVFQINWNNLVRDRGYIKITINGNEAVVKREHLWSILFMLGSLEEQEKLVSPFVRKTQVTKFFKLIGVTTTRDIKKGETINIPLEFTFNPETKQVIIGKGSMNAIRKRIIGRVKKFD